MKKSSTAVKRAAPKSDEIESIQSEVEDSLISPPSYEILTYPADFTLEILVDKLTKGSIVIPTFQRRFVWTLPQASKLIESFLLGLPVPPIFLYANKSDGKTIVVDGQQRLRAVQFFFKGFFGEESDAERPVFRLTNLHPKSPYANKTYEEIEATDSASFQRLNDAVLRSFVVKQLNPLDDTSIYHIFERLNTGGTFLQGQEIRNCVYEGTFNALLHRLNANSHWREIFGKKPRDKRQRDVELILRFFALLNNMSKYEKPMKEFLNNYMAVNRNMPSGKVKEFEALFVDIAKRVHALLGPKPFHIRAGLNAAVYDSVFVAFGTHPNIEPTGNAASKYQALLKNPEFLENASSGTTDTEVIHRRCRIASQALFGKHK